MSFPRDNIRGRGLSQPSASYAHAQSSYPEENAQDEASYDYYETSGEDAYEYDPSYQCEYEQQQYDYDGQYGAEEYQDYQGQEYEDQEQEQGYNYDVTGAEIASTTGTSYDVDETEAGSEYYNYSEEVGQEDYYSYSTKPVLLETPVDHASVPQETPFNQDIGVQQGTPYNRGRSVPQGTAYNQGRGVVPQAPSDNRRRGVLLKAPSDNRGRGVVPQAPSDNRGRGVVPQAPSDNRGRGVVPPLQTANWGRGVVPPLPTANLGRGVVPPVNKGRGVAPPTTPKVIRGKGVVPPTTPPVNQARRVVPSVNRGRGLLPLAQLVNQGRGVVPPTPPVNRGRGFVPPTPPVNRIRGFVPPVTAGRGVVQQVHTFNRGSSEWTSSTIDQASSALYSSEVSQHEERLQQKKPDNMGNINKGLASGQFADAMQKSLSSASSITNTTKSTSSIQNKLQAISDKPVDPSTVSVKPPVNIESVKPPVNIEVPSSSSMASEVNVDTDSDEEEETGFCKYCQKKFESAKAYHAHTRGVQHTTLVMEAKARKGDVRFQKEIVDKEVLEVQIPAPITATAEEEEQEENWMDLDEKMVNYFRERKDVHQRDLNPSEIGKSHLPDDYNCAICEIRCTGAQAFRAHLDGKQHRSNLELAAKGVRVKSRKKVPTGIMMETKDFPAKIKKLIKESGVTSPMIGLDFVTEFQTSDYKAAPRYVCNLCESKCDGSTIIPHVTGSKHRLNYFKHKHPDIYNHLTKYNSKKKKSEMNVQCEVFANDVFEKEGQGEVKVKIELEAEVDANFQLSMRRHAVALHEKAKDLREIDMEEKTGIIMSQFREKRQSTEDAGSLPPKTKRPHLDSETSGGKRDPHSDYPDGRYPRYKEERHPRYPNERYPDRHYPPESRRGRYDLHYSGRRGEPYDTGDFHASYRHMFDPYRIDDPYYEKRMLDERRRLDSLMEDRYRRIDPYEEKRRVDDIIERRKYLDSLERDRLEDMIRRREQVRATESPTEVDVDLMRLRRFEERERMLGQGRLGEATVSDSPSTEDVARLEAQIRRRDHLLQDQLTGKSLSSNREMARQQTEAAQKLSEEASKNPGVDVSSILANLSSSMISSEDDAAMAMQISNALTEALHKYRLQSAASQTSSPPKPQKPVQPQPMKTEPKVQSIPGFGDSPPSENVPAFLRQNQQHPTPPSAHSRLAFTMKSTAAPVQQGNVYYSSSLPPETAKMPKGSALHVSSTSVQAPTTVVNVINVDQPQKQLLESIRKQTELLRQKIALSSGEKTNMQPSSTPVSSPAISQTPGSVYSPGSYHSPVTSQVTSVTTSQTVLPSAYSTQYYQQNFHMAVPNAAPVLSKSMDRPASSHHTKKHNWT